MRTNTPRAAKCKQLTPPLHYIIILLHYTGSLPHIPFSVGLMHLPRYSSSHYHFVSCFDTRLEIGKNGLLLLILCAPLAISCVFPLLISPLTPT